MRFNKLLILFATIFISAFVFTACSDDDDDNGSQTFQLTQAKLNAADNPIDLDITGDPFEGSVGHDGGSHPDSTIRDVYSNLTSLGSTFNVGDIITKKVYAKNPDGSKGNLKVSFAMIKMNDDYDPDNANWAYISIPYNANNDYKFGCSHAARAADLYNTEKLRKMLGKCKEKILSEYKNL